MAGYDFETIERKWQDYWEWNATFRQPNPGENDFRDQPKMYVLDMFPYPSGAGLHVGHPEGYTATDIVSRYWRMRGRNVLHPMGYDAFGLPAEQYAVEHGVHPRVTTERNIANIERQIKSLGFSYDWSRRVATTDPEYYRWTQWIFLRMFNSWYDPDADAARPIEELERKLLAGQCVVDFNGNIVPVEAARKIPEISMMTPNFGQLKFSELAPDQQRRLIDEYRLAYMAEVPVNWCPKLGTVLANEEVTNEGKSDRGNHPVYRRAMKQWMLRITAYAERLLADIDGVDWPEPIKIMQRNWIGKSVGAEVDFPIAGSTVSKDGAAEEEWFEDRSGGAFPASEEEDTIRVYTTRPDTLFGATYMVLAPEHPLVETITTDDQRAAVLAYVEEARNKSELERTAETKEKTGVFTGAYAINPVTRKPIPIWVADYVMMGYGTGAIMAVPAHDTRDFEFAEKFHLPIVQVVQPPEGVDWHGYVDDGIAVNSGDYDGLPTSEIKAKITEDLAAAGLGRPAVNYKLRDWLFSRQRYWGEPFPIVHCEQCGPTALDEKDLPLLLPEMEDFTPEASDDPDAPPRPPLGKAAEWTKTVCPRCGGPATRELNTMPQWAGSCWYYLRYLDPKNGKAFCDPKIERYWMRRNVAANPGAPGQPTPPANAATPPGGVDLYVGGAEHAVLHLLYARFWHKVLFDLGLVSTPEPFAKLFNQGMITSFTYRDGRGVSFPYDQIDFTTADKPTLKATGEALAVTVEKMSKSQKNVINPDEVIAQYGADTFRLYEMFMGPLESSKPWNTRDVPGVHRFLQRVWRAIVGDEDHASMLVSGADILSASIAGVPPASDAGKMPAELAGGTPAPLPDPAIERGLHKLIKKVGEDVEQLKFNTAIAAMMEFVNLVFKQGRITRDQAERLALVLAPFAPHLAEELWQRLGHGESLAHEEWPAFDPAMIAEDTIELPVQVNGKLRSRITVPADAAQEQVLSAALADEKIAAAIAGKTIVKKIVVPRRLVNLVVK